MSELRSTLSRIERKLEKARSRISQLSEQNTQLKDKLSARRYRTADTVLKSLFQLSGAQKILRNLGR